jgi:hypothetical protein
MRCRAGGGTSPPSASCGPTVTPSWPTSRSPTAPRGGSRRVVRDETPPGLAEERPRRGGLRKRDGRASRQDHRLAMLVRTRGKSVAMEVRMSARARQGGPPGPSRSFHELARHVECERTPVSKTPATPYTCLSPCRSGERVPGVRRTSTTPTHGCGDNPAIHTRGHLSLPAKNDA